MTAKRLPLGRRQLAHGLQGKGEGLDGADDDLLALRQGPGQLGALASGPDPTSAGDDGHHTRRALEVEDRFLELGTEQGAIRDHQHDVEDLVVRRVVQIGEEMGGPGNGVGLA